MFHILIEMFQVEPPGGTQNTRVSVCFYVFVLVQEFTTIYQQFFPLGDPTKFANFVFNVFDANKVSVPKLQRNSLNIYM